MSKTLRDRFSNFLSEIDQIEEDNKTLTEDLRVIEKEKAEGYSKFNTETHILIDREKLSELKCSLEEAYCSCASVQDEASNMESQASDVYNGAGYARDEVSDAQKTLEKLLKEVEVTE